MKYKGRCPATFKDADEWAENANGEQEYGVPIWSWDCNFKLDFDGSLLRLSSRFYPPHKNDHDGWEGTASVMIGDQTISEKAFKTETLDELKVQVEGYRDDYMKFLMEHLK